MPTSWDLSRLIYTVRKITGKYDVSQLPDGPMTTEASFTNPPGICDYINDFYLYDLPEHFRSLKLKDYFTFTTIPNCGTYNVPQNINAIEPPIYVDAYESGFYQSPQQFYRLWPEFNFIQLGLFKPDGSTKTFSFSLPFAQNANNSTTAPFSAIQQGSIVIGLTPNIDSTNFSTMETFTDSDNGVPLDIPVQRIFTQGTLIGNQGGTGTVDYITGAVSITFNSAPPNGTNSSCHYRPYTPSRPRDIMFFQQQFFLRPIPNDTYLVKVLAYMLPTTVISAATNATQRPSLFVDPATTPSSAPTPTTISLQGFGGQSGSLVTDLPQYNEWWQMVAYGAALKILIEDGDHDEIARIKPYFEEAKLLAGRKTLHQLASQRIQTRYAEDQGSSGSPGWPSFPYY